jgi:hypothetical protein
LYLANNKIREVLGMRYNKIIAAKALVNNVGVNKVFYLIR